MRPVTLPIKPVSTNNLYGGKRYKKKEARVFEESVRAYLIRDAKHIVIPDGDLQLITRVYVTRKFDTSNCLKLLEDCIAKFLQINDRRFAGHRISRVVVKPGHEKIEFRILPYDPSEYEVGCPK